MKHVYFICTGNTCRSPMAAVLFGHLLQQNKITDITVHSAGIAAAQGCPAEANARAAVAEQGLNLADHTASQLTLDDLQTADALVCMTESHRAVLLQAGAPAEKITILQVPDPYGGDLDTYRTCRDQIQAKLPDLLDSLC